jgi:hypothetical protein
MRTGPTVAEIIGRANHRSAHIERTWNERIARLESFDEAATSVPGHHDLAAKIVKALDDTDGPRGPHWDTAYVVLGVLAEELSK